MRTKHEIETAFADRSALRSKTAFFLVGIGGAGMSGIARMLKHRGHCVRGTDSTPSAVIEELRKEGIDVWIGHTGDFVERGDAVVLTDAIDLDTSPEVAAARTLGCDLFRRSQVLGWLLEGKKTIAVTGTHGKTTTTGMIGAGLRAAGLDPTIVVGAEVPEFGGAIVEGKGEWAVVEACEAYDSLRDFDPYIAVLTNLELDHVDFHGSWEGLTETVKAFLLRVPQEGRVLFCAEDSGAYELGVQLPEPKEAYGINSWDDWFNFSDDFESWFLPMRDRGKIAGRHNHLNAAAAMVTLRLISDAEESALQPALAAIYNFGGAERRLQVLQEDEITIVDDYAHHPTEIVASLQAVRERWLPAPYPLPIRSGHEPSQPVQGGGSRRLIVVYQPHLYSRTAPLIKEFAAALSEADEIVLTDIYPAREDPIPGVSSFRIAELVTKPCTYVPQRHLLPRKVAAMIGPGDVVVGMGAGNISEFAPGLVNEINHRRALDSGKRARVAVLYAGDSAEREISILSGRAVNEALLAKGYDSFLVDVSELLLSKGDLSALSGQQRPDVCFLTVHGTNAEDGAIQGLLELLHLPYTGSGVQASAVAMDKQLTKQVLERAGLDTPKGVLLRKGDPVAPPPTPSSSSEHKPSPANEEGATGWDEAGATGWVVKPNAQGSTVGLSFVESESELRRAVEKAFQYGDEVLVEEWLRGIEISVPVMGEEVLPVVEILPASGAYDFESKYTPGATTEICPARISAEQTKIAQENAMKAHRALGCRGCSRTDMIVLRDRIVCLEVNTLPGMTATSLVPNAAKAAGISFEDLCDWMVKDALTRTRQETV
ncbi:MAG: D-alanine--D-alanine ligase [Armatimonadetes bacterium]|nr:D-alanine--D-alanine ligase [Armatimonadota bacterium]